MIVDLLFILFVKQQTRLGRDINLLRKTSKNQVISKRARNLIKAWNKLIQNPGSPQVNGQLRVSPGLSPALNKSDTPNKFVSTPALSQVRQQGIKASNVRSPVAQNAIKANQPSRSSKAALPDKRSKTGIKSKSPLAGTIQQPAAPPSINSNEDSNLSWPRTPPCASSDNSNQTSQCRYEAEDCQSKHCSRSSKNGHPVPNNRNFNLQPLSHSKSELSARNRASDQKDLSKTNVANRKRTRSSALAEDSGDPNSQSPEPKHPCLMTNSRLSSPIDSKNDVINGTNVRKGSGKQIPVSLDRTTEKLSLEKRVPSFYKGLRDRDSTSLSSLIQSDRSRSISDLPSSQSSEPRKLGRVKTTEQLIEDVQRKSTTPVGKSVIAQLRTNQIQKESDAQKATLPAGVKKRGRKKKNQNLDLPGGEQVSEVQQLARNKSVHIERFLETSVAPTPGEDVDELSINNLRQESPDDHPIALGTCSSSFSHSAYEGGFSSYSSRRDKPDSGPSASPPEAREITVDNSSHLQPPTLGPPDVNAPPSERLSESQILAHLPHIDPHSIDWSAASYAAPESVPVTEELVDRLHRANIEGVNGTYDRDGQFRRWEDMLTSDSVYDEPLFILPYVMPSD